MDWIESFDREKRRQLQALYAGEWWTKERTAEDVDHVLQNSQLSLGLCDDDGSLAAFARVLTDYSFKAIVFDVIVRPDRRGEGWGEAVMRRIETHPRLSGVASIELYCPPEMEGFYKRLGYARGTASRLIKVPQRATAE